MDPLERRQRLEDMLARARSDEEFRLRLREDGNAVLEEEGLLEAVVAANGIPQGADLADWCFTSCEVTSCADGTCFLTVCPESCLPGVIATIYQMVPG
jgi:hypothetical protein